MQKLEESYTSHGNVFTLVKGGENKAMFKTDNEDE